jgi:GNAT superfamily N-acetyltransferase
MKLTSACSVDESELIDFYNVAFENRQKYLPKIWRWLNRVDFFGKRTPLVMENENQVIAHAGMQPFEAFLDGEKHTAAWYIDFKIRDEYQRKGIGNTLTKAWTEIPDCCVTYCNGKSIGVFKKLGWTEDFYTFQHINFMRMFDHPGFVRKLPPFVRKILNFCIKPVFFIIYKINACKKKNYKLEKLSDENFWQFYDLFQRKNIDINIEKDNQFSPARDKIYAEWRVLQSPNREHYYIYSVENFSAVVLIHNNHGSYIDVLWTSNNCNKQEISKLIATLGIYGLKNGAAYMRFYTSHKDVSDYVKRKTISKIRHIRFAYFSKNKEIYDKMKKISYNIELIDSDFEHIK